MATPGRSFEILSLDVTAGDDVAFAHALLRCGTPEELTQDPGRRLRLTIGLRKLRGRWAVAPSTIPLPTRHKERMMPAIIPHLWYSREAEEAANFYASILPDSRVDRVTALPSDSPSRTGGVGQDRRVHPAGAAIRGDQRRPA